MSAESATARFSGMPFYEIQDPYHPSWNRTLIFVTPVWENAQKLSSRWTHRALYSTMPFLFLKNPYGDFWIIREPVQVISLYIWSPCTYYFCFLSFDMAGNISPSQQLRERTLLVHQHFNVMLTSFHLGSIHTCRLFGY